MKKTNLTRKETTVEATLLRNVIAIDNMAIIRFEKKNSYQTTKFSPYQADTYSHDFLMFPVSSQI